MYDFSYNESYSIKMYRAMFKLNVITANYHYLTSDDFCFKVWIAWFENKIGVISTKKDKRC